MNLDYKVTTQPKKVKFKIFTMCFYMQYTTNFKLQPFYIKQSKDGRLFHKYHQRAKTVILGIYYLKYTYKENGLKFLKVRHTIYKLHQQDIVIPKKKIQNSPFSFGITSSLIILNYLRIGLGQTRMLLFEKRIVKVAHSLQE